MPSEVSGPTRTYSEPQQGEKQSGGAIEAAKVTDWYYVRLSVIIASTQPGDGGKSHVASPPVEDGQPSVGAAKIPWKDQVLGAYIRLSRPYNIVLNDTTCFIGYAKVTRGKV